MVQTAEATVRGPTPVECYYIRVPDELAYGYFFLHPNFVLACHTDYGTYSYGWHCDSGATLQDFKRELLRFNPDYVKGKFARRDTLNEDVTRKRFVELILRLRKAKKIDSDRARRLYDDVHEHYGNGIMYWAYDQREFGHYDISEYPSYDYSPQVEALFKYLWPLFIEKLKSEAEV